MNTTQQLLDITPRPKLRLSEMQRLIKQHRIILPTPSLRFLRTLCEDGTFDTAPRVTDKNQWLVYEDSFIDWVKSLDGEE